MTKANRIGVAALAVAIPVFSFALPLPERLPSAGAYSAGVGLTSVALFDDPTAAFRNPAALAMMNMLVAQLTLISYSDARPTSWAATAVSAAPYGDNRFALGLFRRVSTDRFGGFTSFEVSAPMAYVAREREFPFGFSAKLQAENYGGGWVYGFRMDGGVAYVPRKGSMTYAIAAENIVGAGLRAFPSRSWAGFAVGTDTSSFRFSLQARFEKPLDADYYSQNYAVGARWRQLEGPFELRAGVIRDGGTLRYASGFGYHLKTRRDRIDYAVIYDPERGADRTYYLTYGFTAGPGSPTSPATPKW